MVRTNDPFKRQHVVQGARGMHQIRPFVAELRKLHDGDARFAVSHCFIFVGGVSLLEDFEEILLDSFHGNAVLKFPQNIGQVLWSQLLQREEVDLTVNAHNRENTCQSRDDWFQILKSQKFAAAYDFKVGTASDVARSSLTSRKRWFALERSF